MSLVLVFSSLTLTPPEAIGGGVSALSSGTLGCVGPQLRDGHKEGVEPQCNPFRSLISGGMHGYLGDGGEGGW